MEQRTKDYYSARVECVKRRPAARLPALDGLRGVAAVVVLIGHVLSATPVVNHHNHLHGAGWARWWANTPVQTLFDGPDFVLVFFVLSGFVLLPGAPMTSQRWIAYYPARIVRLMLPAVVSVGLALAFLQISHPWVYVTLRSVARDVVLLKGTDYLNGPLWSLQWELWFSLLLPLYVVAAWVRPHLWAVKSAAVLVIAAVGLLSQEPAVFYLSVFALGSLLAVEYRRGTTARLFTWLSARRGGVAGFAVLSLIAFNGRALLAFPREPSVRATQLSGVVVVLGAVGLVLLTLSVSRIRTALQGPVAGWLGRRSFSLYLVHWPIVEYCYSAVGHHADGWPTLLAVPLSLAVGEAFYRLVERPGHRLSRRIHGEVFRRLAERDAPVAIGAA